MTTQHTVIPRIACIEIPVSNLKAAVEWYGKILGLKVIGEFQDSWKEAMLQFPGNPIGVPTVYLVQTDSQDRLKFYNTNYGYTQSIIDFYTADLAEFHRRLKALGVATNRETIELQPGETGGFGFFDPDGNSFGATNAIFEGQEVTKVSVNVN